MKLVPHAAHNLPVHVTEYCDPERPILSHPD